MAKLKKSPTHLKRIADALERLSPPPAKTPKFKKHKGALWEAASETFALLSEINHIPTSLLIGIDQQRTKLLANTRAFANGAPANNALLWGARGMGKSALVKAVHNDIYHEKKAAKRPVLIEILREDLTSLAKCLEHLRKAKHRRFILFCDDLSFDNEDTSYKSLKALLEGGIAGRPENVIFYATSNQRHLLPRDQSEYDSATLIHGSDITNEKISLSDRFGIWLGFHNCSDAEFHAMVASYATYFDLNIQPDDLKRAAHQWAMERGNRSGRVAWQFIQHLRGHLD